MLLYMSFFFPFSFLELDFFRKALRTFRLGLEEHRPSEKKIDVIKYNVQATCLLSYLVGVIGKTIKFDQTNLVCMPCIYYP